MTELRVVGGDLLPPPEERRHLLSIADLSRDDVERLLATSRSFARSHVSGPTTRSSSTTQGSPSEK